MGTDNQRLRIMITDDADTFVAMQFLKIRLELGSEIIIFDIVDRPGEIA
jgi:hypothetical protein